MSLQLGSHSSMAAFASVAQKRPLQILTNVIRNPLPAANFAATSYHGPTATGTALNLNPIAFMGGIPQGGAAATTVLANTDTLSTAALATMFMLAIQYCAQPPLTRKFLDSRANKKGITMVEEIVKIGLSAVFFISCGERMLLPTFI